MILAEGDVHGNVESFSHFSIIPVSFPLDRVLIAPAQVDKNERRIS